MYDINIQAVLNGYVVRVGCQTVVFQSLEDLLAEMRKYLTDPEQTEARYREFPNARFTLRGPEVAPNVAPENGWAMGSLQFSSGPDNAPVPTNTAL